MAISPQRTTGETPPTTKVIRSPSGDGGGGVLLQHTLEPLKMTGEISNAAAASTIDRKTAAISLVSLVARGWPHAIRVDGIVRSGSRSSWSSCCLWCEWSASG